MIIKDLPSLESVYNVAKLLKKPIVKFYPDGKVIGTDLQLASLNIICFEEIPLITDIPYIFITTEIAAFVRLLQNDNGRSNVDYDLYKTVIHKKLDKPELGTLVNHLELGYNIDELYNRTMLTKFHPILYKASEINKSFPDMFSMKVSDGAKIFNINNHLMTSFNSIHPANKTDSVDVILRDYDAHSYTAEFIIYKKKGKYELHEFLRLLKL